MCTLKYCMWNGYQDAKLYDTIENTVLFVPSR
jgi:hypothetical protein